MVEEFAERFVRFNGRMAERPVRFRDVAKILGQFFESPIQYRVKSSFFRRDGQVHDRDGCTAFATVPIRIPFIVAHAGFLEGEFFQAYQVEFVDMPGDEFGDERWRWRGDSEQDACEVLPGRDAFENPVLFSFDDFPHDAKAEFEQ